MYANSSNTNLELIATLAGVAPDGTAVPITFGAVLDSQRALSPLNLWTGPPSGPGIPASASFAPV